MVKSVHIHIWNFWNNKNLFIAVKKSYYQLARIYHPDRVAEDAKVEAKEKFNIIHSAYSILSDPKKKAQYDAGSNILFTKATITAQWENFLKEVNQDDINNARKKYQGSLTEKNDLIREFVNGKGSLTYLINNIPFMRAEDESRIVEIIKSLMDNGEIPKMAIKKIRK